MEKEQRRAIKVALSYAPSDEKLKIEIEKQLLLLQREELITIWSKSDIDPGKDQEKEISAQLHEAHIILLLISPDYVASESCYGVEMAIAMERSASGEARVIPVLLRPVDDERMPFHNLSTLPTNSKPIVKWPNRDDALADVVRGVRRAMGTVLPTSKYVEVGSHFDSHGLADRRATTSPSKKYTSRKTKIVVIDDDSSLVEIIKYSFKNDGFFVEGACTGREGLACVRNVRPDFAIIDLAMPDMSGIDVAKKLREEYEDMFMIFLTGYSKERYFVDALEISVDGFLEKGSFDPKFGYNFKEQLIVEIRECINRGRIDIKKCIKDNILSAYELKIDLSSYQVMGRSLAPSAKLQLAEIIIHLIPDHAYSYGAKGSALLSLQNYEAAVEAFDRAISLMPYQSAFYCEKGLALLSLQSYETAAKMFNQAISLMPDHGRLYCEMGRALLALQNDEEAEKAFDRAIYLNPKDLIAIYGKCILLYGAKKYEEVLSVCNHAIHINPGFALIYYVKCLAIWHIGTQADAIARYKQAILKFPRLTVDVFTKSAAYYSVGCYDEAFESLEEAIFEKFNDTIDLFKKFFGDL